EHVGVADVLALDEVGAKERVVDRLAARLRVGPFAELLRKAAVVGHLAIAVWQAFGLHARAHLRLQLRDVVAAAGEELLQALAFRRRLRGGGEWTGPTL